MKIMLSFVVHVPQNLLSLIVRLRLVHRDLLHDRHDSVQEVFTCFFYLLSLKYGQLHAYYKIYIECYYRRSTISMARTTVPMAVVIIIKGNPTLNHLLKLIG
jgi:hypothetical protein